MLCLFIGGGGGGRAESASVKENRLSGLCSRIFWEGFKPGSSGGMSRDGFAGMAISGADLRGGSAGPLANDVFPKGPDAGG